MRTTMAMATVARGDDQIELESDREGKWGLGFSRQANGVLLTSSVSSCTGTHRASADEGELGHAPCRQLEVDDNYSTGLATVMTWAECTVCFSLFLLQKLGVAPVLNFVRVQRKSKFPEIFCVAFLLQNKATQFCFPIFGLTFLFV